MTITQAFNQLKSNLELKDSLLQLSQQRHRAIRTVIENSDLKIKETKLIGSYQRKTRIHPVDRDDFDIDILVVIDDFVRWVPAGGVTPQVAMQKVKFVTEDSPRYAAMSPKVDSPTVSLTSSTNLTVELVPAYLDRIGHNASLSPHAPVGRAYWIPDPENNGSWKLADYDYDAEYISTLNQDTDGWFVPTVKMIKAIKRGLFPNLDSYSIEALAAKVIPIEYASRKLFLMETSYPLLLHSFFTKSLGKLAQPISIPGSLTPATRLTAGEVQAYTTAFNTISGLIESLVRLGDQPEAHKGWKILFGLPYPME